MGMSALRIDDPRRRDRLLLLNAFAILLLTILGAAGESLGMDRLLRTSTVKRRVHSLFRQGCLLYDLIPNMPDKRLRPLIERYQELLAQKSNLLRGLRHRLKMRDTRGPAPALRWEIVSISSARA